MNALLDLVRRGHGAGAPFDQIVVPPVVFAELQHPNTPAAVRGWVQAQPAWLSVRKPTTTDPALNVDAGEREAICLAREIHAEAILMDDRAGRAAAVRYGLPVVGTLGLLEEAALRGWLDLPQALGQLQATNAFRTPA